jgi:hypothetical protein
MNIELNEKNQSRIKELIAQRDRVMEALTETISVILDSKDIDYTGMKADIDKEIKNIILTKNGESK